MAAVTFIVVSLLIVALGVLSAWWAGLFANRRVERHIKVDHLVRDYVAWLPVAHRDKGQLPVVFAFHAAFGSSEGFEAQTRLHLAGEAANVIIVYPQGYKRSWNAGDCCGAAMRENIDDRKFIRSMLDDLESFTRIDRRRITATGFSNGARLCYFIAGTMSDVIAAIAPVSGAILTDHMPTRPIPVFHFHGLADTWAPYRGGRSVRKDVPEHTSIEVGLQFWRKVAGTTAEARVDLFGDATESFIYSGSPDGTIIQLCKIAGLGHHWPGMHVTDDYEKFNQMFKLGPLGPAIFINDAILKFLASWALPAQPSGAGPRRLRLPAQPRTPAAEPGVR